MLTAIAPTAPTGAWRCSFVWRRLAAGAEWTDLSPAPSCTHRGSTPLPGLLSERIPETSMRRQGTQGPRGQCPGHRAFHAQRCAAPTQAHRTWEMAPWLAWPFGLWLELNGLLSHPSASPGRPHQAARHPLLPTAPPAELAVVQLLVPSSHHCPPHTPRQRPRVLAAGPGAPASPGAAAAQQGPGAPTRPLLSGVSSFQWGTPVWP